MEMTAAELNVIFSLQGAGRVKDDLEDVGRSVAEMESTRVSRELEKAGYHPTTHRYGSTQSVIELSRATGDGLETAIGNVNRALAGLEEVGRAVQEASGDVEEPQMSSELLSVGGAAKRLGVSTSLLRKLEYRGVTTPAQRVTGSDRRVYTQDDIETLRKAIEERRAAYPEGFRTAKEG